MIRVQKNDDKYIVYYRYHNIFESFDKKAVEDFTNSDLFDEIINNFIKQEKIQEKRNKVTWFKKFKRKIYIDICNYKFEKTKPSFHKLRKKYRG